MGKKITGCDADDNKQRRNVEPGREGTVEELIGDDKVMVLWDAKEKGAVKGRTTLDNVTKVTAEAVSELEDGKRPDGKPDKAIYHVLVPYRMAFARFLLEFYILGYTHASTGCDGAVVRLRSCQRFTAGYY